MLVIVALFVTTASAYVAVDTQKQHLILTDSHFDPEIVAAFFEAQDEIVAVYEAYKEI
jgi:response regulator RpfG family c-di-GMP phosphodiesterase